MGLSCFGAISGIGLGKGWVGWMGSLCGAILWSSLCDANKRFFVCIIDRQWQKDNNKGNTFFITRTEKFAQRILFNREREREEIRKYQRMQWIPRLGRPRGRWGSRTRPCTPSGPAPWPRGWKTGVPWSWVCRGQNFWQNFWRNFWRNFWQNFY